MTGKSRRPPLLAVDVLGALNIVGMLLAYLSVSTLLPTGFAIGYGEPFWPFLAAGGIVGAASRLPGRPAAIGDSAFARAFSSSR